MASNSNVRELPPGDPKLTASILSHLKSQGLFDQLRRDCLGDVDTKPAYLNLKQRVDGYITKFLATQTWTPDMNKNHVRDRMRREINESGMLSAGLDHLVDQIVNPKIYHVFTPEVENGVRQYLGLSSTKDAPPHQFAPSTDAAVEAASKPVPRTPFLPPPAKSEFSIDETTQDVPGSSFSPEEYAGTLSLEELTDSSCEPQLMIVTESNERTEEAAPPPLKPKKIGSRRRTSSESSELRSAEMAVEPPSPKPKLQVANWSSVTEKEPSTEDVTSKPHASLSKGKPDFLKSNAGPVEKDVGKTAELVKKEVKPMSKDKKERKPDSGKSKEHGSHSSKSESHSKDPASKKTSLDVSRSKTHKHKSDGDSVKDAKHSSKEKDKRSAPREKSSSRDEASKSKSDSTKDERSKGSSHHSSRPKEGDGHGDRKRSDDKHRSHHSSSRHEDKKRHGDKHSREEKPREHRSDGHRSHSDSQKDKDKSSHRDSSRHHKSSKSSDRHSEHSKSDRGHEKERKHGSPRRHSSDSKDGEKERRHGSPRRHSSDSKDGEKERRHGSSRRHSSDSKDGEKERRHSSSRRNSFDSKDGATSKASAPRKTVSVSQDSFLMSDDASLRLKLPETPGADFPEVHTDSRDASQQGFQGSSQDGSVHTAEDSSQEASQATSSSNAHQDETKLAEDVADKVLLETPPEMDIECSHSAVQLVEEKEAEILRFSYVTDEMRGNSSADLQLVSSIPQEAELQQNEVFDLNDGVELANGDEVSGSSVAGPLGELKLQGTLEGKAGSQKTDAERRSAEKRRQKRRGSDSYDSDGAWSDVTVSSVHTSDLSSYDDRISVSSGDETPHHNSAEKKKIPLKDVKKITSSSNEDDDRMSKSETEPNALDGVAASTLYLEEVVEHVPAEVEELQPICLEVLQSKPGDEVKTASPSTTVTSEEGPEPKMGLRRTRKINPKYVSEEFSSIFTKGKCPAGTIDFSELAKYGKEKHHEEPPPGGRPEPRKAPTREDASQDFGTPTPSDTEQLSDASVPERSRRPSRRPSSSESRSRSESTSSKRYESSDLYKPRPVIKSGTRRSRPLPATLDEEEEEEEDEMEDYDEPNEPLPKRHRGLKVCIGFKRGQPGSFPQKGKAEPGT